MAGPVGSVLLPQELNPTQVGELEAMLRAVSGDFRTEADGCFGFQVVDVQKLGGSYVGDGRPFGSILESADRWRETEKLFTVDEAFGFLPGQDLGFYAMSKSFDDHEVLGILLLHFAQAFGGVVDFGGALLPPLPPEIIKRYLKQELSWPDVAPFFEQMIQGMNGKIVSIEYNSNQTTTWASHVGDAEFMKSWLHHPNFHMIK